MLNVADVLVDEDVQVLDIDEGEVGRVQVCMEAGIYNFYFFLFFHLFFSFFSINCFIEPPKERVGVKNENIYPYVTVQLWKRLLGFTPYRFFDTVHGFLQKIFCGFYCLANSFSLYKISLFFVL